MNFKLLYFFIFISLNCSTAYSYENTVMRISNGKKVIVEHEVGLKLGTIHTPNKTWECSAVKTYDFQKIFKQELITVLASCKTGTNFLSFSVTCAQNESKFGPNVGVNQMNHETIAIGDKENTYELTIVCSTVSFERLDDEIKKIKSEGK